MRLQYTILRVLAASFTLAACANWQANLGNDINAAVAACDSAQAIGGAIKPNKTINAIDRDCNTVEAAANAVR